jgi:predicted DCC family thiol-disulfide oxidoreductase YuxK
MSPSPTRPKQNSPILLFDNECGVCRRIAGWVKKSAQLKSSEMSVDVRAIGDDPEALRALNPGLDIWEAYATIHLVMPDGSMKRGGEAVAECCRARWMMVEHAA